MTHLDIPNLDNLSAVERALADEVVDNLNEFAISGQLDNIHSAKVAIGVLWHYVYEKQKGPATYDGDGEILNHGRCVV